MFTGWYEKARGWSKAVNIESISASAYNFEGQATYEMLGRDRDWSKAHEPVFAQISSLPPAAKAGRVTPGLYIRH
jgi:hypothetical protein